MNTKADRRAEKAHAAAATVVAPIIEAIEAGSADPAHWRAPWHDVPAEAMTPHCPSTGRNYTGGNRVALMMHAAAFGALPHWGTFQQWRALSKHSTECNRTATNPGTRKERRPDCTPGDGCHIVSVAKGQHVSAAILRPLTHKETNATGDEVDRIHGWAAYGVFHAGQVTGYEMPAPVELPPLPDDERRDVDHAFRFAANVGARVEESPTAGASYSPQLDRVMMPDRDRLTSGHGAWSTMAHELTHWTGHESRLDRAEGMRGRFGDHAYAAEELVAELGAAFTLAALGRSSEPRDDHAHYLASWLRVLKENPRHLWTIAGKAEKASGYLIDRVSAAAPATVAA